VPKARKGRATSGRRHPHSPDPSSAPTLTLEAYALAERGEEARARELFRQAIRINPHIAAAWLGLGREFMRAPGGYGEGHRYILRAVAEAERTLREFPDDRACHVIRGMAHKALFYPAEFVASARSALDLAPDPSIHGDMLFQMNCLPETTPEALFAEACRWDALYAAPLAHMVRPHPNAPDPGRRLRIGYVSSDLYGHAIAKFLPPVFELHDRSQFALTVYSVGRKTDAFTETLRGMVERFVPCPASGAALEASIRADEIDILVDLSGHTMPMEYFLVLARKPAPIQVSWAGVLSTTGLRTMDYFLGSADLPCPGTEHCFSETVYRLPRSNCCYRPPLDMPVAPSPCLERGYVTFGSFNSPFKIGPGVVKVWSAILRSVPQSRILLKYDTLDTEVMRGRFQGWFSKEGISRERVEFQDKSLLGEYLASYGQMDIALDPFPYQGGSTTFDALWMGLPMVAMEGRLAVQRSTTSALKAIGLPDTIAHSPEQYVKAAVFLAGIVGKIPDMRRNIRKALQSSPFMDESGFVRDLEAAYRDMWGTWCRKQAVSGKPARE
jgi:tetratricopeptide (TPR) repeat protein